MPIHDMSLSIERMQLTSTTLVELSSTVRVIIPIQRPVKPGNYSNCFSKIHFPWGVLELLYGRSMFHVGLPLHYVLPVMKR